MRSDKRDLELIVLVRMSVERDDAADGSCKLRPWQSKYGYRRHN